MRAVFKRALYRRTHLLKWLLPMVHPNYFVADFDLIYSVERLTRIRDFGTEAARFNEHPANRGFLRRTLCFRVSTSRLRGLIRESLPRTSTPSKKESTEEDVSAVPFEMTSGRDFGAQESRDHKHC
jgi:hypothetical protein